MQGNFPEEICVNKPYDARAETDSGLQRNTVTQSEDFSALLNSNSRGNSKITVETVRAINEELMSRQREDIRMEPNAQILATINSAITVKKIPDLHGSIGALENGITKMLDHKSSGLQKITGAKTTSKLILITPKETKMTNLNCNIRDSSLDSNAIGRDYDIVHG